MRKALAFALTSIAAAALVALAAAPAAAHETPAGCQGNSLGIELVKDRTLVRNGDTVNYQVWVENEGDRPCDVTGVGVTLQLPARDGTPTGRLVTLGTSESYPAGTALKRVDTVAWVVDVEPGVFDAVPQARVTGDNALHDTERTDHDVNIDKTIGTDIIHPQATTTVTPNPPTGDSPLDTTFTYTFTNTSPSSDTPLQPPSFSESPDICADTPTRTGGDTNNDNEVDNGESWTYTCTGRITEPGTTQTTVTTSVNTALPGDQNRPVTVPPATASVLVNSTPAIAPPATTGQPATPASPTAGNVLGKRLASPDAALARGDARCIRTPARLRVRARERTIVRVRVREQGERAAGALVRIVGPGIRQRKLTNRNGVATFRVRARRSGRLVVQSDRCLGADRVTVLRARRTSNNQIPRGTG
ncbi:MAG TPA: hypothetical protein VN213_19330 [Solirubrobacteraceae bacterium]|nr:hypothetical protein [Solirubrobacteraceae bacterium]